MSTHPPENPRIEARPATPAVEKRTGLTFRRYFTKQGRHPYDELAWETRSAVINDERGKPVFEQHGIEVPTTWSQTATNIVASKYFRGTARVAGAREQRAPAHLAGGGHHLLPGPSSRATSRPPRTSATSRTS